MTPLPDQPVLWTGPVESPRRYQVTAAAVASAVTGGEGLVYCAHDTDRDVDVALKLLTAVNIGDYGRIVERSIPFTTIAHPNLMAHVEVFIGTALTDDPTPDIADFDVIYSVADWIDGHPLPDVADSATDTQLFGYLAGLARALSTLHHHRSPEAPLGIVHRDVKPSNVRISTDDTAVLIDFGVARPLDDGDLTQGVGTYRWRAPEVLSGSGSITTAVDVWGLGALAYWSLTGQPPGLEGASTAKERLSHTPRCQELNDPVGIASHIAALLETNPTKRPNDLARWANQLDAIVAGRRRTAWKRPTAVTAAIALLAIPGTALLVDGATGSGQNQTPATTSISTAPRSSGSTEVPEGLVPAVGDTWNVACLGGTESTIVSGAEPGELIRGTVEYADDATPGGAADVPDPNSYLTGPSGITSPIDITGPASQSTRHIGGIELTADATGSFVIEWHCDRALIGTPFVVSLVGARSQDPADITVESTDYVTGLDVQPLSNSRTDDGSVRMAVGTTLEIDVFAQLTPSGKALVREAGIEHTGRNFDPLMRLSSSNREVGSVLDSSRGGWIVTALSAGSTVLEAAIVGTDHVATLRVEVLDGPPTT